MSELNNWEINFTLKSKKNKHRKFSGNFHVSKNDNVHLRRYSRHNKKPLFIESGKGGNYSGNYFGLLQINLKEGLKTNLVLIYGVPELFLLGNIRREGPLRILGKPFVNKRTSNVRLRESDLEKMIEFHRTEGGVLSPTYAFVEGCSVLPPWGSGSSFIVSPLPTKYS